MGRLVLGPVQVTEEGKGWTFPPTLLSSSFITSDEM